MIHYSFIVRRHQTTLSSLDTPDFPAWSDSGHGGQVADKDGDEPDGLDEGALVPLMGASF